jgi:hypothetical protein
VNQSLDIQPPETPKFVGTFTGDTLVPDSETGLLTDSLAISRDRGLRYGNGCSPLSKFNAAKKLQFLNYLCDYWPDLSLCARKVGISIQTVRNHMAIDTVLADCVEEFRSKFIDGVHATRIRVALKDSGAFDRMTVLNAHMSELYNPKIKVEVEHTMNPEVARRRNEQVNQVIDAEVIETVRRAKKLKTGNAL